jgi:hypothetical protein
MTALGQVEQALLTCTDPHVFGEDFRKKASNWTVASGLVNKMAV